MTRSSRSKAIFNPSGSAATTRRRNPGMPFWRMSTPCLTRYWSSMASLCPFPAVPGAPENHTRFVLLVRHSGHREEHMWDAPIDDKGIKGNPNKTRLHGGASSMNYACRYLKTNVFNIQTFTDDDGNAAGAGPGVQADHARAIPGLERFGRSSLAPTKCVLAEWIKSVIRRRRARQAAGPCTSAS